jgi:hypothetical protein
VSDLQLRDREWPGEGRSRQHDPVPWSPPSPGSGWGRNVQAATARRRVDASDPATRLAGFGSRRNSAVVRRHVGRSKRPA